MQKGLNDKLFAALKGEMTPKFLATRDAAGIPNVVPIISIEPYDRRTLIFGNYLMWKTERNLRKTAEVSVCVISEELYGTVIRGRFLGFQRAGAYVDQINSSRFLRYNAYTGIRSAGSIEILEIMEPFQLTKMDVLSGFFLSRMKRPVAASLSEGKGVMNATVSGMFARLNAVKMIAFLDPKGFPLAVPVMSLQPAGPDVMVFRKKPVGKYLVDLADGAPVAVSVITMDPVAFQVKGVYREIDRNWGAVQLREAFHASVPFPGKRIA